MLSVLGMAFGVVSFTFVVSNVHSVLSQRHRVSRRQSQSLMAFEALKVKFGFSRGLAAVVEQRIRVQRNSRPTADLRRLAEAFPGRLRSELLLAMHGERLRSIRFFQGLPAEVLVALGSALTPVVYTEGALTRLAHLLARHARRQSLFH